MADAWDVARIRLSRWVTPRSIEALRARTIRRQGGKPFL